MAFNDITGAILAGGKSSRMGRNKALLTINGVPLIQHVAITLKQTLGRVIVISDRSTDYEFLGLPIYPDLFKNAGPIAGIHSALVHAGTESVFIASCDLPFLSPPVIKFLADGELKGDVRVLKTRERVHPLCGVYARTCLPLIEDHLKRGQRSVHQFLCDARAELLEDFSARIVFNVNTPEEYNEALRLAASNGGS